MNAELMWTGLMNSPPGTHLNEELRVGYILGSRGEGGSNNNLIGLFCFHFIIIIFMAKVKPISMCL